MRLKIAPILCVALLVGACARSPGDGGVLRVIPLEGDVFLATGSSPITEAEEISPGEVVRTGGDGRAVVQFPDGQAAELAPVSELSVGGPGGVELLAGQALFHAPAGLTVGSGPADIRGTGGFFRVDRFVGALRLGVYAGSATVEGWDGKVRSLEQVAVSAGVVPEAPQPLNVDTDDRWDGRLLGQAIDLGIKLEDFQRDIRAQLPGAGVTTADVLPSGFPVRGADRSLSDLQKAEALVAAMVAFQAAEIDGLAPLAVLDGIASLRERGASWIIVVAAWHLVRDRVITALARITDLVTGILVPAVASGASVTTTGGTATTSGGGGGGGGGSGGGGSGTSTGTDSGGTSGSGSGGGGSGGGGGQDPGDGPSPPPDCGSQLECTVQDVLGGVDGVGDGLDLP